MRMRNLFISLLSLLIFNSCSTELDVNADFRETPIMFGLINQNDSINYVRLQKAFSNENGNALEIAKEFDSLYYDTTKIVFQLIEINLADDERDTVDILNPEYNLDKVPGIFAAPGQYVYKTTFSDWKESGYEYIFEFINKETGLVAFAKTDVVGCARILNPVRYQCNTQSFENSLRRNFDVNTDGSGETQSFIEFDGPTNAAYFSCEAIIEYTINYEDGREDTLSTEPILWNVHVEDLDERVPGKPYGANGGIPIGKSAIGNYLTRAINTENDVSEGVLERALLNIQFFFYYYNTSYENYLEVNGNFNPLSQTKPLYTNVQNGLGLIASRSVLVTSKIRISTLANFEDSNYFRDYPDLKFFFDE